MGFGVDDFRLCCVVSFCCFLVTVDIGNLKMASFGCGLATRRRFGVDLLLLLLLPFDPCGVSPYSDVVDFEVLKARLDLDEPMLGMDCDGDDEVVFFDLVRLPGFVSL